MLSINHALQIITRAFREIYSKRLMLARGLAIHVAVLLACGLVTLTDEISNAWALVPAIYSYTMLAINTHRIILLNNESLPYWGELSFSWREARFILFGFGIFLMCIPFAFLNFIPSIGKLISMIGIAYISGRFALIFPATAVDQSWSFQDAWNASSAHWLLMVLIVSVFPFLLSLPETLLSEVQYSASIVFVLSIFTTVFIIAALSLTFEEIQNDQQRSENF